ncbi:hypothetical protein Esti_004683 [Eimeria stiedai]
MVSKSAQLPNVHLRKEWQPYVKTWFNQPARKQRRRLARQRKAAKNGIRPTDLLRPVVHAPTQKYNMKVRAGRGFTLEELKAVGVSPRVALSIGIAVDHRRRNRSQESLTTNVNRLKLYLSKLVLFQRGSKAKKGLAGVPADTPKSQLQATRQVSIAATLPIQKPRKKIRARVITEEEKKFRAYATLRKQLRDAKNVGKHSKKLAEEAEAEKNLQLWQPSEASLAAGVSCMHAWGHSFDLHGSACWCEVPAPLVPASCCSPSAAAAMHFEGESSMPLQGLPYTPYAPPSGGISIPLPLPASPRHLLPCKVARGRGAPTSGSEGGGGPRPRAASRGAFSVAEYIRRSLCDPHTPRVSPSPRTTQGGPLVASKVPPQGAPCRRARSDEARPSLGPPSFLKAKGSGAAAVPSRAAADTPWSRRGGDPSPQQLTRSVRGPLGGGPRGPLWGPLDEISEGERSRFLRALEEVERLFADKLAECAAPLPKEMASKVYAASSVEGKLRELRGALVCLTQQAGEPSGFGKARGDASQLQAARKREGLLQTALTEARANLTAARDQVSRLRRLILPLQHGVAAFVAVQRRDAAAQGASYTPFTPYTPAAAPQGGPEGPLSAQELGDFQGRLFDDAGGGCLPHSTSDAFATSTPGGPPASGSDEGPLGPLHVGKRAPLDSPYLLEGGGPRVGRELRGGVPLETAAETLQTQRPPPEEEGGDSFSRGGSRGEGLHAHEGGTPLTASLEREAPSRGLFSLSSGKPATRLYTNPSVNKGKQLLRGYCWASLSLPRLGAAARLAGGPCAQEGAWGAPSSRGPQAEGGFSASEYEGCGIDFGRVPSRPSELGSP